MQEEHNNWNLSSTRSLDEDDFISLDSTGITGPRQEDGSLPDLDFLKLAKSSALIDAGVSVGIPFAGNSPDIGYAEYGRTEN